MTNMELIQFIVDIHNHLTEINVRGDDAIRMAEILQKCRAVVAEAQKKEQEEQKKEKHSK